MFDEAITRAHSSRKDLAKMPSFERKKILLHVAKRMEENKEEISGAIAFESGKIKFFGDLKASIF